MFFSRSTRHALRRVIPSSVRDALLGVNHADPARASVVGSVGRYLHAPERPDGAVVYERAVSFRVHPDRLVRLGLPALPSPLG